MRCDEFVDVVYDMARDGLTQANRTAALSHVAGCNHCAARLAAERYLDEALGMARSADTESTPAPIGLALMQAFDERRVAARESRASQARPMWFAAAAAAALLAIVLVVSLRIVVRRSTNQVPKTPPDPEVPYQAGSPEPATIPGPPAKRQYVEGSKLLRRPQNPARRGGKPARDSVEATDLGRLFSDAYALTDFIPLTHLSSSTAIASGQVIRIKVPLSAFLSLGLPVSPEHADELVNAELVVGDDGVQRAVRLVR